MFFSSRPLSFYILTNDDTVFVDIRDAAAQYNSSQLARCGLSSDFFLDVLPCFKDRIQVLFSRGHLSPRLGRDDWRIQVLCYGSPFLTGRHVSFRYHSRIIFKLMLTHKKSSRHLTSNRANLLLGEKRNCSFPIPTYLSTESYLYPQDMLPDVNAGIFLDNDMLVLQVPATKQF